MHSGFGWKRCCRQHRRWADLGGIDGVWWRARTGSLWRDLSERAGPWETAYAVFRRWQIDETWVRVLKKLQVKADTDGIIEWEASVGSTVCRAEQHAAGAAKRC
ncbi:transposase [Streptomyces sp. TE33382]